MVSPFTSIARVVKTQGRRGELGCELLTDFPERFQTLQRVYLWRPELTPHSPPRPFAFRSHWFHKGLVIISLEGVDDLNAAEAWIGAEVQVPSSERVSLPPGMFFSSDLLGCMLLNGEQAVGTVELIEPVAGAPDLLHVRTPDDAEVLVPFVQAYLREVDLPSRRIVMQLPEGLLEINEPRTSSGDENEGSDAL